jgi:signal transduction histidine kinase/ActR/RegA family two-component response regulator
LSRLEVARRWEGELQHTRSDGTQLFVESRMVRVAEGPRSYVLETIRDIGERRALEQQLRQSQKMEGIGRLAGGIAHDFNNLLGVIVACAELQAGDEDLESIRSRAAEIRKSAERAAGLTRQLLAFSRKQVLEPKVVDLNAVLADMSQMLERVVGEDVQFRVLASPDLGRVLVDPSQVEQVLLNLVVNARDAMPHGGKITLETQNVEIAADYIDAHPEVKPGRYVMIGAADSGIGMDLETQTHIFEPFYTTKERGTGLGLAMVYGIVKQSAGHIWVYSEPGVGTIFKIYFPRVDDPLAAPDIEKQPLETVPATETVLLVEDFDSLRHVTHEFLEMAGYTVISACNATEALQIAADHCGPIHLLLTDVVMPGVGGVDLARQIKFTRPEIRILYMSGYTANAIVHQGVLDRGLTLLNKPFTRSVLAQKVREALDAAQPVQ